MDKLGNESYDSGWGEEQNTVGATLDSSSRACILCNDKRSCALCHNFLNCCDPTILSIINCVRSLTCTAEEVLECLECRPSVRRLLPIFTCILLNDIRNIENLLTNQVFGLNEIKNEIRFVENEVILINNSVNSPVFGLNEIKNEVRFVENEVILINNSVNSPVFGLNEIKNEIRFIENEVILINNTVNNNVFGLNEIKNEIRFIENEIILINNTVNNNVFGLNEIKNEIRFIENEVILINNTINNNVFGLNEIKNEIRFIENQIIFIANFCPNVTSGSILNPRPQSSSVLVSVKNTNTTPQTVRVRVLRDDVCPAAVLTNVFLPVNGCCSNTINVPFNNAEAYQIEVFNLVPGMTVASIELNPGGNPVAGTRLTASQFVCQLGNCV